MNLLCSSILSSFLAALTLSLTTPSLASSTGKVGMVVSLVLDLARVCSNFW